MSSNANRVMPKTSLASTPSPLAPVTLVPTSLERVSPGPRTIRTKDLNDSAWREIYAQVSTHASVAARMVQIFEAQPQLADSYPAVYLRAWITVERRRAQLERNQRIGNAMRRWIRLPLGLFGRGTSSALTSLSDIATMPDMPLNPSDLGLRPANARDAISAPPAAAQATGT